MDHFPMMTPGPALLISGNTKAADATTGAAAVDIPFGGWITNKLKAIDFADVLFVMLGVGLSNSNWALTIHSTCWACT